MNALLAPHHDDVLLSLHGIAGLGSPLCDQALVVVCFSEESDALAATCHALHASFGLTVIELGLLEARRRGESLRSCLKADRELASIAAHPLLPRLVQRLGECLGQHRIATVWAPLTPVHVDHALTRIAAEQLALPIRYYEDQPYAATYAAAVRRASAGLELLVEPSCVAPSALLAELEPFTSAHQLARAAEHHARHGRRCWRPLAVTS
jgi:hypothetical protein